MDPKITQPLLTTVERHSRWRRVGVVFSLVLTIVVMLSLALSVSGTTDPTHAHAAKATLDHELTHARAEMGIPDTLLTPITTGERRIAAGDGSLFYNYGDAASRYQQLYTQLLAIEQSAPDVLQQQAQTDMQAFGAVLTQRKADGFQEVTPFQQRYDAAQRAFMQATTPRDFAQVSALAQDGTQALTLMRTTYDKLQSIQQMLQQMQATGATSRLTQQFYDQDMQAFRGGASASDYQTLATNIDAQLVQLIVDDTAAQPYVAASLLKSFQTHIDQLRQYGDATTAGTFQQQHDADAKQLASAVTPSDFAAVAQALAQQDGATALLVAKDKATQDFATLQQLVNSAASKTVIDPANGRAYPAAYEYSSRAVGIGDASDRLKAAKTVQQYNDADFEITSFTACLKAMLANMNDPTPHNQAHQTDLQLLQYFNVTSGRVVVISLREQTARFYENGQLVNWSYVTTGRPELPSVPGWHVAMARLSPTTFRSPDPVGSPNYYQPTHINYAIAYNSGGYFLHDAWWRSWFGPNSNLPHHDPAAFNGGSHGCVNFPLSNMGWIYKWTQLGTPIILY